MPRKGNRKGCEEDQVRDGETALREIWREWRIPAKDRSWRVVIENALETSEERKHREMTTGTTRGEEQLLVERDSQQGVCLQNYRYSKSNYTYRHDTCLEPGVLDGKSN